MLFIHTADWHLGRIFHGVYLTEDQAYVLEQLVALVRETGAKALLVSGDIYDRAVPPPEAINLLDDVISRMVLELKVPVILIAGNHDSPSRLGFGSRLLAAQKLHVISVLSPHPEPIILEDRHGPIQVYAFPYAEPAFARESLQAEHLHDHQTAMRYCCELVLGSQSPGIRKILLTHAFVSGGEESESERPLSVGGAGCVEAACLEGFHYVALGHLHRPQAIGPGHIHYAGSLLKYSFSEASHTKSVTLVEMDAAGVRKVERLPLTPRCDVRCLQGTLTEILGAEPDPERRRDYLKVTLLDREPVLDAMGKLRMLYPNVLQIERPHLFDAGEIQGSGGDHRQLSDIDLFRAFFHQVTGEEMTSEQTEAYAQVVDQLRQREREAAL
jgi:DNA repair protein SbcD/Mre11